MKRIITFGELMLRLAPEGYLRFVQADSFQATYGGGEANVAVSLAGMGMDAAFVTKLPKHEIGQAAVNSVRQYGVDTRFIARGGNRVGIYYLEKGASQRPSKVIYDRAGSSIAEADVADFDWAEIFKGADWFHFTGITPALSDKAAELSLVACKQAKAHGVKVSFDLNFRKNLWTSAKANEVISKLTPYIDVCIANEEDAEKVFGIKASGTDVTEGTISHDGYKEVAQKLVTHYGFKSVAITLRESISATDNNWSAMLYQPAVEEGKVSADEATAGFFFSKKYPIHIVDRVGGGDSFGAGLIYAMLNDMSNQDCIEFAVAASCLKHTIEGDFNHVSVDEVKTLMKGDGSGRVQR